MELVWIIFIFIIVIIILILQIITLCYLYSFRETYNEDKEEFERATTRLLVAEKNCGKIKSAINDCHYPIPINSC